MKTKTSIIKKYQEFNWLKMLISGCKTYLQTTTVVTNLINLFTKRYNDDMLTSILWDVVDIQRAYLELKPYSNEVKAERV